MGLCLLAVLAITILFANNRLAIVLHEFYAGASSQSCVVGETMKSDRHVLYFNNKNTNSVALFQKIRNESKKWVLAGVRYLWQALDI